MRETRLFSKQPLWLPVLAAILCLLYSATVFAAPSKKAVTNAYKAYCQKNNVKLVKQVDIDKNGIREMVYQHYATYGVCTYNTRTKKVVKLAEEDLGRAYGQGHLYYKISRKFFVLYYLTTSDYQYTIYKLNGTKATKYRTLYSQMKGDVYFEINGKKVSRGKFLKQVNTILGYKYVDIGYQMS